MESTMQSGGNSTIKINQDNSILYCIIKIVIVVVSLLLLFYTGYRAAKLSFTIDESLSFNVYAQQNFMDIISYKIASSNSHMINTLCLKYISHLLGTNEFLLRFPSVLSHLIYIIVSYKIIKKASSPIILLAGFLLLNLNPFLLDFFSLARGYAMSVAFTLVSIYYILNYIEENRTRYVNLSLSAAAIAVLSNFSLSIYYVSLIGIINIYWLSNYKKIKFKGLLKKNIPVFIFTLFLFAMMFEPIRKLIKFKEFYDGGTTGFWKDTVDSLIQSTLYGKPYKEILVIILKSFIGVSAVLMIIYFIYSLWFRKWKTFTEKYTVSFLLLLFPCIVTIAQHFLTDSLFLINRTALFFIPLFFIPFIFLLSDITRISKLKIVSYSILCIASLALASHTISSLNGSYTLLWKYDSDTKKVLSDLEKQIKKDNSDKIKLGVMWLFEPTVNFYRTTKNYLWLDKVTYDYYANKNYDYYYLADSSMTFINDRKLSVLKHYQLSNSYLVK